MLAQLLEHLDNLRLCQSLSLLIALSVGIRFISTAFLIGHKSGANYFSNWATDEHQRDCILVSLFFLTILDFTIEGHSFVII